jgi:cysteine desulfurase
LQELIIPGDIAGSGDGGESAAEQVDLLSLNIIIPGTDADQLIEQLPGLGISTGSACTTGQSEPSHVLTAIGLDRAAARSSIRIGLGRTTTLQDVLAAARQIADAASSQRASTSTR